MNQYRKGKRKKRIPDHRTGKTHKHTQQDQDDPNKSTYHSRIGK